MILFTLLLKTNFLFVEALISARFLTTWLTLNIDFKVLLLRVTRVLKYPVKAVIYVVPIVVTEEASVGSDRGVRFLCPFKCHLP